MARILSMTRKQITTETLHNIAVREDESYIANGIVVHNCKSYIVPILSLDKGMKIEKFTPRSIEGKSNADILKSIQFAETIKHCSCCAENFNSF